MAFDIFLTWTEHKVHFEFVSKGEIHSIRNPSDDPASEDAKSDLRVLYKPRHSEKVKKLVKGTLKNHQPTCLDKICQKMKKIPMLFFHIFPIMKNPTIISQTRQKKTQMYKNWIATNIYQDYEVSPFSSVFAQICLSQANCLITITTTDRQNISPCLFCNVSVETDALLCGQYIVAYSCSSVYLADRPTNENQEISFYN